VDVDVRFIRILLLCEVLDVTLLPTSRNRIDQSSNKIPFSRHNQKCWFERFLYTCAAHI